MATTGLFVEIIVIGVLAEAWFATALLALLDDLQVKELVALITSLKDLAPIGAVLLLALTYAVGWVFNFVAQRVFVKFERKSRELFFKKANCKFRETRALVFQHGKSEALQDLLLDRHVIRIARSNVVNFFLFALALTLHWSRADHRVLIVAIITSLCIATLSFVQWRARYQGLYRRLTDLAEVIRKDGRIAD